jgi:hypothetical protein
MIELRPTWWVRVVLAVVIIAPSVLALGLAVNAKTVAFLLFSIAFVAFVAYAVGTRVIALDDRGLTFHGWLGNRHVPWREVAYYTYASGVEKKHWWNTDTFEWAADHFFRFFERRRRVTLTLHLLSRDTFTIDGDAHQLATSLDAVMDRLHAHLGARPSFEPYLIDEGYLRGPTGSLSVLALDRIAVDNRVTFISSIDGTTEKWSQSELREIRNGDLFLLHLIERGLPVDLDRTVTLPSKIAAALEAAEARQRAMPVAEARRLI